MIPTPVSDDTLHAFVDGELDHADREALLVRMQTDAELAQRVCAVRRLRDMVRLAYAEPPRASTGVVARRPFVQRCAFGCLVLFSGLVVGWMLRGMELPAIVATMLDAPVRSSGLAQLADPDRVMLHIDSAAPDKMLSALDRAEQLLVSAEREGRKVEVEVIANSHGLTLLRAGYSPYAERIARMQRRHANVQWVACSQTIARVTSQGEKVELLPAARAAPTAIGEIVTRLQQGWTYIRV